MDLLASCNDQKNQRRSAMALEPKKILPFLIVSKKSGEGQKIKLIFAVCIESLVGANVSV